jgi:uncharacterized protein YndB with AHSA1/START domain
MNYQSLIIITIFIVFNYIEMKTMESNFKEKAIIYEVEINARPAEVYKTWTTREGFQSFFAQECKIDLKMFGDFHIHFFPDNPKGTKGAEDEKIISFQENKMLSFTWGFPPNLKYLRENQKTVVLLKFTDPGNGKTFVKFTQSGWGDGEAWDKGFEYFKHAWIEVVFKRLIKRFKEGPIDWKSNNLK